MEQDNRVLKNTVEMLKEELRGWVEKGKEWEKERGREVEGWRREREEMGKVVEGKEEEVEGLRIEGRLREEEMEMGRREVVRWRERYEGLMREVKERER